MIGHHQTIPAWISRTNGSGAPTETHQGSTVHVVGFNPIGSWKEILAASIAENFFGAIWNRNLEVNIDGIEINRETIYTILQDTKLIAAVEKAAGDTERFRTAKEYLRTMMSLPGDDVFVEDHENLHLGHCQVRILLEEGLPKVVGVLRNGMFITDALPGLKRFGDFKDFVALVECQSEKGLKLLREMEPPKHDTFEPQLLSDPQKRDKAKKGLTDLANWVRDMLKRHAKNPVAEETEVDEMAEFFGDDDPQSDNRKEGEDVNPEGAISIQARPFRRNGKAQTPNAGPGGSGGGGGGDGPGDDDDDGPGTGGGSGGEKGKGGGEAIHLADVRQVKNSTTSRSVFFTPEKSGKVRVELFDCGAELDSKLDVVTADSGTVKGGEITNLKVVAGKRVTLHVELAAAFEGALKVVAHEI